MNCISIWHYDFGTTTDKSSLIEVIDSKFDFQHWIVAHPCSGVSAMIEVGVGLTI